MFDHRAEIDRRVGQFAAFLRPMHDRAHGIAHGPCFIIFEEKPPLGDKAPELVESREAASAGVAGSWSLGPTIADEHEDESFDLPDDGWRQDDSQNRFVQFNMERNWFCMDLPRQTLFRAEAEVILRDCMGFFYLTDRQQFTLYQEDIEGCDPFRKVFIYGDEEAAAGEMAFIFFRVWSFAIDAKLYVSSASFDGNHRWENGVEVARSGRMRLDWQSNPG